MRFETRRMDAFLQMVKTNGILNPGEVIACTGGGAMKYAGNGREMSSRINNLHEWTKSHPVFLQPLSYIGREIFGNVWRRIEEMR